MPHNPTQNLNLNRSWYDIRDLSAYRQQSSNNIQNTKVPKQRRIIEATGFAIDEFGQVELVAHSADNSEKWQQMPNCGEV